MSIENILPDYSFLNPAKEEFDFMVNLNHKMTIFITELYLNAISIDKNSNDSDVAVNCMLRQILVFQDSVTPLIRYGKSDAIEVLLRVNLELIVQLLFMVDSDKHIKGKLYLYHGAAKEKAFIDKILSETSSVEELKKLGIEKIDALKLEEFKSKHQFLSKTIDPNASENKDIIKYINNIRLPNHWYTLYDPKLKTVESMFNHMGVQRYYENFYRSLSKKIHSSNVISGRIEIYNHDNCAYLDVRFPFKITNHLELHLTLMNKFILDFCTHTKKDYFEIYQKWYIEQFRDDFQKLNLINLG